MDSHADVFREEAYELLGELENSLLELENSPEDMDVIGRVFRAMHTIKGSGAMFGFDDISSFTHEVETVFDMVRNGKMKVSAGLIDLTLEVRDQIRTMLDASSGGPPADAGKSSRIISGLRALASHVPAASSEAKTQEPVSSPSPKEETEGEKPWRIVFRPGPDTFRFGSNPSALLNELRSMGDCRVVSLTDEIPDLADMDPEACYTSWEIYLSTTRTLNDIKDVFIFVEDNAEISIEQVDVPADSRKVGEILLDRGIVDREELDAALGTQKRIGEVLVEMGRVKPLQVESALAEQKTIADAVKKKEQAETRQSIRVPSDKLDRLVDLVGELVTVQARLTQEAANVKRGSLVNIAEEVERLTAELRDNTMNIRMMPIGATFSKFTRLVRDLSKDLGKEIELLTEGAETELDKTVLEKLNDPLVHIIRNSIDHGVEPPDVRVAAGKKRAGVIHLSAFHSGADVMIRIRDDGKGMDKDVIREKAVKKGIMAHDSELTDKEIFGLVLLPGFSTAEKVTSVSGRGVGMDVVKKALDGLRGSIEIESEKGRGTTINLKLPLTLAIIEGLLVKIGAEAFVIPLSAVEECIELTAKEAAAMHGRHIVNVRGQVVPYIRLRESFDMRGERPDIEQIVITQVDGHRVGFVVDDVIGEHQTVIKSLGKYYREIRGVSGATILGDGSLALILDVPVLLKDTELQESLQGG